MKTPLSAPRSVSPTIFSTALGAEGFPARLSFSITPDGPWGALRGSKLILTNVFFLSSSSVSVASSDMTISWTRERVLSGFLASWTLSRDFPLTNANLYRISWSIDLSSHRFGESRTEGSDSATTGTNGPARPFGYARLRSLPLAAVPAPMACRELPAPLLHALPSQTLPKVRKRISSRQRPNYYR